MKFRIKAMILIALCPLPMAWGFSTQDIFSKIMTARSEKDWNRLVIFGQTHPDYFSCNYPNLLLSQAEAYHELGNDPQALGVYSNILARCKDNELLRMSYEQAIAQLDYTHLVELFKQGSAMEDMGIRGKFEQMRLNYLLSRLRVAIVSDDQDLMNLLDTDSLTLVETLRETNSAEMIAWKYLDAGKNTASLRWFSLLERLGGLTKNTELGRSLAQQRAKADGGDSPVPKPKTAVVSASKPTPPPVSKPAYDDSPMREVTGKSKAALYKERELWQLFGDGKFKKAEVEIRDFKQLMPDWEVPPKMAELLEKEKYKEAIQQEETDLWALLEQRDYTLLDARIADIRDRYPKWRPPVKLMEIKEKNVVGDQISEALTNGDWDTFATIHDQYPQYFDCDRIDFLWGDADYHTKRREWSEVHRVYDKILQNCTVEHRRITLERMFDHLPDQHLETVITNARKKNKEPAMNGNLLDAAYRLRLKQLGTAITSKDFERAHFLRGRIEQQASRKQDPVAAGLFGWTELNRKRHKQASNWFNKGLSWGDSSDPDLMQGLLLSLHGNGQLEEAAEVVERIIEPDEKVREVAYSIYASLSWKQYELKQYRETLSYLNKMENYGIPTRDEIILKSWTLKELGRKLEADRLLEKLRYQRDNGNFLLNPGRKTPNLLYLRGRMEGNSYFKPFSAFSVKG